MTDKIKLSPIHPDELETLYKWRNDPYIMARTRQWRMLEWKEHKKWFENLDPNKNLMRVICIDVSRDEISVWVAIGACGLTNIDWVNRSCELSIYIGEEEYRGCGYGKLVIQELKKICFDQMNMHRFWAEVYEFNQPMIMLLKKCGFGEDGRLVDTVFREGKYYDSYFFNFLEDGWKEEKGVDKLMKV